MVLCGLTPLGSTRLAHDWYVGDISGKELLLIVVPTATIMRAGHQVLLYSDIASNGQWPITLATFTRPISNFTNTVNYISGISEGAADALYCPSQHRSLATRVAQGSRV